jgi:hypothetical protein
MAHLLLKLGLIVLVLGLAMFAIPFATIMSGTPSTVGFWSYCALDARTNAQYPPTGGILTTASICTALDGYLSLGTGISSITSASAIYCTVSGIGTCTTNTGSLSVGALAYDSNPNVAMYYVAITLPTMTVGNSYTFKLSVVDSSGSYSAITTIAVVNVNTLISSMSYYILNGGAATTFTTSTNINVKPTDTISFLVDVTSGTSYLIGMSAVCTTSTGTCPSTSALTGTVGTCPAGTVTGTCYLTSAVSFPVGTYTLNGYLATTVSGQPSLLVFSFLGIGSPGSGKGFSDLQWSGLGFTALGVVMVTFDAKNSRKGKAKPGR